MRRTWKVAIALGRRITSRRAGLAAGTTAKLLYWMNETLVLIIYERVLHRYHTFNPKSSYIIPIFSSFPYFLIMYAVTLSRSARVLTVIPLPFQYA